MAVRAIWQGVLTLDRLSVPVKLYSAVVDRDVHFHLLHSKDRVRVEQRMVNPNTGETVEHANMRKGFPVGEGTYVLLEKEEIDRLAPASSRTIEITRFVPTESVSQEWYDRPYFLSPVSGHEKEYRALADAIRRQKRCGVARWVMRKKAYAGALCSDSGHLLLITLHHAEEVVAITDLDRPTGRDFSTEERSLAEKLVDSLAGDFKPDEFRDEYQAEVRKLIEAKQRGKKPPARRAPKPRPESKSLADALRRSVQTARR